MITDKITWCLFYGIYCMLFLLISWCNLRALNIACNCHVVVCFINHIQGNECMSSHNNDSLWRRFESEQWLMYLKLCSPWYKFTCKMIQFTFCADIFCLCSSLSYSNLHTEPTFCHNLLICWRKHCSETFHGLIHWGRDKMAVIDFQNALWLNDG